MPIPELKTCPVKNYNPKKFYKKLQNGLTRKKCYYIGCPKKTCEVHNKAVYAPSNLVEWYWVKAVIAYHALSCQFGLFLQSANKLTNLLSTLYSCVQATKKLFKSKLSDIMILFKECIRLYKPLCWLVGQLVGQLVSRSVSHWLHLWHFMAF